MIKNKQTNKHCARRVNRRDLWVWEISGEIRLTGGRNTSGRIIKQVSNKRLYHACRMLRGHTDFSSPFRDQKNFCFQLCLALLLRWHGISRSPRETHFKSHNVISTQHQLQSCDLLYNAIYWNNPLSHDLRDNNKSDCKGNGWGFAIKMGGRASYEDRERCSVLSAVPLIACEAFVFLCAMS